MLLWCDRVRYGMYGRFTDLIFARARAYVYIPMQNTLRLLHERPEPNGQGVNQEIPND